MAAPRRCARSATSSAPLTFVSNCSRGCVCASPVPSFAAALTTASPGPASCTAASTARSSLMSQSAWPSARTCRPRCRAAAAIATPSCPCAPNNTTRTSVNPDSTEQKPGVVRPVRTGCRQQPAARACRAPAQAPRFCARDQRAQRGKAASGPCGKLDARRRQRPAELTAQERGRCRRVLALAPRNRLEGDLVQFGSHLALQQGGQPRAQGLVDTGIRCKFVAHAPVACDDACVFNCRNTILMMDVASAGREKGDIRKARRDCELVVQINRTAKLGIDRAGPLQGFRPK